MIVLKYLFSGNKDQDSGFQNEILKKLEDDPNSANHSSVQGGILVNNHADDYGKFFLIFDH